MLPSGCRSVRGLGSEAGPMNWRHAELDELLSFLKAEARAGRFKPTSLPWELPPRV